MSTVFLGEGNIGSINNRTVANGNETPQTVISLNTHFDNLVRNKKTDELEDQGGFWAPVEFWVKDPDEASLLITKIFKKGMRIKVDGVLVREEFEAKETGEKKVIMKVRTFRSGVSICLQRLESVTMKDNNSAAVNQSTSEQKSFEDSNLEQEEAF
ncbi:MULTISPECIES: single stranded DNA-binding domain-containing protein [Entomomonas]|uniref:Single-stranded DNA-binding protein n=1 Tax=Entomomonas asaccharolytica TaxID=2785331 RepID=A0A974NHU9_9GAMM|nr:MULTISPECIES: single-stranded DNA-binding protein [Entomomonas]QQP86817.1 single-stranded DNA-binding protein [Entomomonas asaccharolytica]UYZ83565.1 single-stranded DNA-binding protein [Entomomonas sp. E2T0]